MSNDVLLIPVTAVQPDLVTQTDVVVYVPLASKTAHGIVKIGNGLTITKEGLLSFDRSEVTIKEIALNGNLITPDENKRVNIILTKNDVGLSNVDNTSDDEKPISTATQEALDILETDLTDHILDVDDRLIAHINDFGNPHRVTQTQVGLGNVDNTSDEDKPISRATQRELTRIQGLIKGSENAVSYESYEEMINDFNTLSSDIYKVGQSVYIKTLKVPDLWIYGVEEASEEFTYIDDATIESILRIDGTFKVGYYRLAALDTLKVDLSNYVTIDGVQSIFGDKDFKGLLTLNSVPVATQEDLPGEYIKNVSVDDDTLTLTTHENNQVKFNVDLSGYLPLTAGNKKRLTDLLYADEGVVVQNNKPYKAVNSSGAEITLFRLAASNAIMIGDTSGNYDLATYSMFRPVTGAKKATLGSNTYKWVEIHGVDIYQNGKQVANAEDLSSVTDATLSSDSKTLTITKRDGTSFDFQGGGDDVDLSGYLSLAAGPNKQLTGALYVKSSDSSVWDTTAGLVFDSGAAIGSMTTGTLGVKAKGNFYIRIGDVTEINVDASSMRPSSKEGSSLGTSSYQWLNLYATNVYQDGKQVANTDELSSVINATLSSDSKTLTITKRDGSSLEFQGGGGGGVPKGSSSTSSSTGTKVVDCEGFVLEKGAMIDVTFTNSNGGNLISLNVNGTGAKTVEFYKIGVNSSATVTNRAGGGDASIPYGGWKAGDTVRFLYNGYNWVEVMNLTQGAQYTIPYQAVNAESASTSTTRTTTDNSTNIATTAFVQSVINSRGYATVEVFNSEEEALAASQSDPNKICLY